jgi:hypothetical protein
MKPEIVGKILNLPVLEPNDPVIISASGDPYLTVKRGLVRFGSKGAFLGCPMFHEGKAYAEAVLLTVASFGGADEVEIILESPDALGELIENLEKVRDKMVGFDKRYDQIVGYDQIWEAAQADLLEEMKAEVAADIEVPDGFTLCPACVGEKRESGDVMCMRCGGERIVKKEGCDE